MNDYMKIALNEAEKSAKYGDIPVGAVIVKNGAVVSKAHNKKHIKGDPTCHAEILAIKKACKKMKDFRLEECDMYVTLEPCVMCYGAILSARINNLYFGAYDKKFSIDSVVENIKFNHSVNIVGGVMEEECSNMLTGFFSQLRSNKCNLKYKKK